MAPWIQRVLLVMLGFALLWIPIVLLAARDQPLARFWGILVIVPTLAGLPFAIRLLRLGQVRRALGIISVANLINVALAQIGWGVADGPSALPALFIPLIFAALAGSPRLLIGLTGIVVALTFAVAALEWAGSPFVSFIPQSNADIALTAIIFGFCVLLVGLFLLLFGRSLRAALAAALRRQHELERYRDQLEQVVDDRTVELRRVAAQLQAQNAELLDSLELARDIQLGLLPSAVPWDRRRLAIHTYSLPAFDVGGDFYTYDALDHDRVAVALGDISGKGVSAALIMSLTLSLIEDRLQQTDDPGALLSVLNGQIAPRLRRNRMNAAVLCAVIDLGRHTLRIANAGMIPPLIVRDGQVITPEAYDLPIGSLDLRRYHTVEVAVEPGDLLLMLSDGIVEAHGLSRELFGFARLEATLRDLPPGATPAEAVSALVARVSAFCGDARQHDDITVVALQIAPGLLAAMAESPDEWVAV